MAHSPPDFHLSLRYPQSNWAPLVLVPEWVGLCTPRPLWVSPTTSPVRLGVSPAAAPTPTGVFIERFGALFPPRWSPGLRGLLHSPPFVWFICVQMGGCGVLPTTLPAPFSTTLSPALSVYLRECGAAESASGQTACPVRPTLRQSWSHHSHRVLSALVQSGPSYRS